MNPPPSADIGPQLITLMAALMLVLQLLLAVQPMLFTSVRLYAIQSLFLAGIAGVVAFFDDASEVYVVAVLTVIGKVIFLPWLLNRQLRRIKIAQEVEPLFNAPATIMVCGGLTLLGYLVARPFTSLERLGNNTLAIAITLVLTGFFLMINRRKAISQVIGLLTVENGVMLAAIALTTYGMPLVVEFGIFFDVLVAVMILGILIYRIRETFASMDTSKLNQLKGGRAVADLHPHRSRRRRSCQPAAGAAPGDAVVERACVCRDAGFGNRTPTAGACARRRHRME